MLLVGIFILSGVLAFTGLRCQILARFQGRMPRPDGVVMVGGVLVSALLGWILYLQFYPPKSGLPYQTLDGFGWIGLTALLYLATAWRRKMHLPIWVNDLFILLAGAGAIFLFNSTVVSVISSPTSNGYIGLGAWAMPLTLLWIWATTRLTAALNRAPQVTGGYLGFVALTLLIVLTADAHTAHFFPSLGAAALAGAGLATIPFAVKRHQTFNIGWSAALAMGFLIAQIAIVGLLKNATFAILLLSAIVLGLPLLDVSFYRLRSALQGKKKTIVNQHLRLHEALQQRGIAPLKVSLLYLAVGVWICVMGVLASRFVFGSAAWWQASLRLILILLIFFIGFLMFFSLFRVLMQRSLNEEVPPSVEAFGVRVTAVSMSEAMAKIESYIESGTPHHVATSDANAILCAQQDPEYAEILRRAALITPDGFGVIWGMRLLNLPVYERVTGVDMVTGICEMADKKGYSIYILGSAPGIAATAAEKLAERYPGMRIAGTQHGFYSQENISEDEVVRRIRDAKPDVLFVAFGIPKQEKFIAQHFEELQVPVSIGVGGSFDVYSEKLKRAPVYIQRSGLEWAYRVWQEPWRWRRMSYVPRFMVLAVRTWILGDKRSA
ncbi:MAG: WecB/TagA/CpsF family glycosyltransferase [Abditibacteriaceae bacterium]